MMKKSIVKLLCLTGFIAVAMSEIACNSGSPNATVSQMSHGEKLYRARCGNCHRLRKPYENTPEEWVFNVEKFGKKMTPEQRQLVLNYLFDARRKGTLRNIQGTGIR